MRLPEWLPGTCRPTRPEHSPRRQLIERLVQPLARFPQVEAAGGLVLLACTVIDLVPADALSGAVLFGNTMATLSSEGSHDVVRLAAAASPFQAHSWRQALEQEGIRCQVLGDYLNAGFRDIPGISAEVWATTANLARAEAILR